MPRKKMSLQALCVRSMRTGRALAQDRERAVQRRSLAAVPAGCAAADPRMANAEHPLVAAHRAHAAADLVGQGLKGQAVIGRGQRAGDGVVGPLGLLWLAERSRWPPQTGA